MNLIRNLSIQNRLLALNDNIEAVAVINQGC